MALTSPGVEVTVIDQSQYVPSAVNTVPYFLVATAQNKVSSDGVTVAAGTLAANANKTYLITSQRDLAATFGVPFFYNTTTGTPINGYELNEYGLLAAYSALGVSNRCYVQRADIDLAALTASLTRPLGTPPNNSYWVDSGLSTWGMFEWNAETASFELQTPIIITEPTDVVGGDGTDQIADSTPLDTIGSIGDYAVTLVNEHVFVYYKKYDNTWNQVGSDGWKTSWPAVAGTNAVTGSALTVGANMIINGSTVTVSSTNTVAGLAAVINAAAITGVTARAVSNRLYLYATSAAGTDGSTLNSDGFVEVVAGPNLGTALLTQLGITASQYPAPEYYPGYSYQQPKWISGTTIDPLNARPTGSVWQNMSTANNGLSIVTKQYSASLGSWLTQSCPAYVGDSTAIYALDPTGGGKNIPVGTLYASYTSFNWQTTVNTAAFTIFERYALGATVITGTTVPTGTPFVVGNTFTMNSTQPGTASNLFSTVTIGGTGTVSDFIAAVSAAANPYVTASVNSAGNIVFTHSAGGAIFLENLTGTPVTTAGFAIGAPDQVGHAQTSSQLRLSNFVSTPLFEYTASDTAPDSAPADGRLWYYSAVDAADIMIQDDGVWQGYQNVTNDARGYNLTDTNATGPIISASAPTTQTNTALSPLVYGDLWIDTSDLENYPKLYRWQAVLSLIHI